jgi:hypothetical protein
MVFSGPIAPERNPPINPQYYSPRVNVITGITLGQTTTITFEFTTELVIGNQVRLLIPPGWGCRQLNEQTGYVLSVPTTTSVILSIDSSVNVDPFMTGPSTTIPQALGIGDVNTGQINSFGRIKNLTYIPGSYRNISPR